MSIVGIDIGNENCYIAAAKAGGIETIANDYSQRSTPSYVAFGDRTRNLGVAAKNKQITNVSNTIYNFKRLIGRKYQDPVVQADLNYVPYSATELNSQVGFKVQYLGKPAVFNAQQIMAMMLTKLKEISESSLKTLVQDCVLSVPIYYNDTERRAILDAAEIAGFNVLKLMNETTAVALAYGFYMKDLPDEKPKYVVFVDLGQSSLQASACAFTKGKLKMLGCAFNRNLGGRDFDIALARYFIADFLTKYKLDVMSNKKALVRLLHECENLKKQMSAYSLELPMNIECFMNDIDVSGKMKRDDFEKLTYHHLDLIEYTLKKLMHDLSLNIEDIDSVQIVGGSSRIPAFKTLIQKVFGKEPSTMLNQDEAVARGCAIQCAMLSPAFKVREFTITDVQPYPIKLVYQTMEADKSEIEMFPLHHQVPFSRMMTFNKTVPFTIEAFYTENFGSSMISLKIGNFAITNALPTAKEENSKIKIKFRVNEHGIFSLYSAHKFKQTQNGSPLTEKSEIPMKSKPDAEEPMESDYDSANSEVVATEEVDENELNIETKEEQKVKYGAEQIELSIRSDVPSFSRKILDDFIKKEDQMKKCDKMEKEKANAKNAVEDYVYEIRGKLTAELEEFVTQKDSKILKQMLEDTENWLYNEGEDQQESVYTKKLERLKARGDPIMNRYHEFENCRTALRNLGSDLQSIYEALESYRANEELYEHIDEDDIAKVHQVWETNRHWYNKNLQMLLNLPKYQSIPVTVLDIANHKEILDKEAWSILKTPKPVNEPTVEFPPDPSELDYDSDEDKEMQHIFKLSEEPDKESMSELLNMPPN